MEEHNKPGQMDALIGICRRMCEKGLLPMFGEWNAHFMMVTNWKRAGFGDLDLSRARVRDGNSGGDPTQAGVLKPSLVLPMFLVDVPKPMLLNGLYVMSGDQAGGYWVTACLRRGLWDQFDRVVATMEH